jgi:hypothetical protein
MGAQKWVAVSHSHPDRKELDLGLQRIDQRVVDL